MAVHHMDRQRIGASGMAEAHIRRGTHTARVACATTLKRVLRVQVEVEQPCPAADGTGRGGVDGQRPPARG